MSKSLLVVESPTKARTLKKYLGNKFTIKASVGHIKNLPKNKLGVNIENDFEPEYVTIKGKGPLLKELREAAKKADKIYLAPDPDREGEAIAWHISNELKDVDEKKIYRVLINEFTPRSITEAIKNPIRIDKDKVYAQQARRVLDRLVGYKISPLLWKKVIRGLSAGRVQSVALRLVCEREREINVFVSEEYWSIIARLEGGEPPEFEARLNKIDDKKAEVKNAGQADTILGDLKNETFIVDDIEKQKRKRRPVPPFITSTLQQEASRRLGFSVRKTMMVL
jgi:DNA topoisomerase-1